MNSSSWIRVRSRWSSSNPVWGGGRIVDAEVESLSSCIVAEVVVLPERRVAAECRLPERAAEMDLDEAEDESAEVREGSVGTGESLARMSETGRWVTASLTIPSSSSAVLMVAGGIRLPGKEAR